MHIEQLNDLYSSLNIIRFIKSRRIRWPGHLACMGERRSVYRVLMGKPVGKNPLWRPCFRWKIKLQWIFRVGMDWIELAEDRDMWRSLVNAVITPCTSPWAAPGIGAEEII
jgi:hypothetical protein